MSSGFKIGGAVAIVAVIGSDEGRVAEEALARFNELRGENTDDFANDIIEGVVANAEEAYQACARTLEALQTLPFFGGGKVVWLKAANFLADDRTGGAERTKEGVEAITDCLKEGLPPGITFLLSASGIDKRRAFYKTIGKAGEVAVYDRIDVSKENWEDEVAPIVLRRAKELGLEFADDALELFVQRAGEDTRQIGNELEKLRLYLGDESLVSLEAVEVMVPLSAKGVIWEISRALERRNGARAIALIDKQLAHGEPPIAIMRAAFIPTMRNLFMVRLLLESHPRLPMRHGGAFAKAVDALPEGDKAWLPQKKAGGVNTWGLFHAAEKARNFKAAELRAGLEACLEADRALVTTQLDPRFVLHRLVAQITGHPRRKAG